VGEKKEKNLNTAMDFCLFLNLSSTYNLFLLNVVYLEPYLIICMYAFPTSLTAQCPVLKNLCVDT
jgi:hypothetical protein